MSTNVKLKNTVMKRRVNDAIYKSSSRFMWDPTILQKKIVKLYTVKASWTIVVGIKYNIIVFLQILKTNEWKGNGIFINIKINLRYWAKCRLADFLCMSCRVWEVYSRIFCKYNKYCRCRECKTIVWWANFDLKIRKTGLFSLTHIVSLATLH